MTGYLKKNQNRSIDIKLPLDVALWLNKSKRLAYDESTNDIILYNSVDLIMDTADAADSQRLRLCGGGDANATGTRGAQLDLNGNEATATGVAQLAGGAVAGGHVLLATLHDSAAQKFVGSRGQSLNVKVATASSTLSGATTTFTALIPAKSQVLSVCGRITTTVTGCTSFQIGDGSDADRWGAISTLTANTTITQADATADPKGWFTAANDVVITAVGGAASFSAGVLRLYVYYIDSTGPTSA